MPHPAGNDRQAREQPRGVALQVAHQCAKQTGRQPIEPRVLDHGTKSAESQTLGGHRIARLGRALPQRDQHVVQRDLHRAGLVAGAAQAGGLRELASPWLIAQ